MRIYKKALPLWSAFFVFVSFASHAACPINRSVAPVEISYVYDGDTVKLKDGRRVRIIGINAPETEKEGHRGEFLADQSTERLKSLLNREDVSLLLGQEKQDRYKRWLGHIYVEGQLVSERLLRDGLAFHIAIPPNVEFSDCLKEAELSAGKRGLWSRYSEIRKKVSDLKDKESGFKVLEGSITKIRKIRSGYIVEVNNKLAIKVDRALWLKLDLSETSQLLGQKIEVRGWIRPKSAKAPQHYMDWFLAVRHPSQFVVH